jgi:hypothetical protein
MLLQSPGADITAQFCMIRARRTPPPEAGHGEFLGGGHELVLRLLDLRGRGPELAQPRSRTSGKGRSPGGTFSHCTMLYSCVWRAEPAHATRPARWVSARTSRG